MAYFHELTIKRSHGGQAVSNITCSAHHCLSVFSVCVHAGWYSGTVTQSGLRYLTALHVALLTCSSLSLSLILQRFSTPTDNMSEKLSLVDKNNKGEFSLSRFLFLEGQL